MMAARAILRREAEHVLRLQFGSELLDGFLEALESRERECDSASAFRERQCGVGLPQPDELSDATQDVNALFCRRHRRIGHPNGPQWGGPPLSVPVCSLGVFGTFGICGSPVAEDLLVNAVLKAE